MSNLRYPRGRIVRFSCQLLCLLLCVSMCFASDPTSGKAPPNQVISMSVNPHSVPPPTWRDFDNAVDLAIGAGIHGVVLTWTWSSIEPAPKTYDLTQFKAAIDYFSARHLQIYLGIQVLNTVAKETPSDLLAVPFDSPLMVSRFHGLLDHIRPLLDRNVRYISIGNEVDVYLDAHLSEWATYRTFYEDSLRYVHKTVPGTQVGVTVTYGGASGPDMARVAALSAKSDVVILTYYPIHGDFQVNGPQSPLADFPKMLTLLPRKPILLQEVGYPSSPLDGSSEAQEAQFVTNALSAWHGTGQRIPFLNYFLEHDLDTSTCATLAKYYGLGGDAAFKAYLCSLGLRRAAGSAKPAWHSFVNAAR